MSISPPPHLAAPFAVGGDKIIIPLASQPGGRASLTDGFPQINQVPLSAGGIPPHRIDVNGVLNQLSQFAFWAQSGGNFYWSASLDYALPCFVWGNNNRLYQALQASGPGVAGVGAKDPTNAANTGFWLDFVASITPPASTSYPLGIPMSWRSTTLGPNMVWANRDAILFADWPEFTAMYNAGGLAGMVLSAGSSVAEQQANLGKWALLANSSGLLTPGWGGQFMRNWTPGSGVAGAWGRDEIRNVVGRVGLIDGKPNLTETVATSPFLQRGYSVGPVSENGAGYGAICDMNLSRSVPTGPENVPAHIRQPVAIYMGNHA